MTSYCDAPSDVAVWCTNDVPSNPRTPMSSNPSPSKSATTSAVAPRVSASGGAPDDSATKVVPEDAAGARDDERPTIAAEVDRRHVGEDRRGRGRRPTGDALVR